MPRVIYFLRRCGRLCDISFCVTFQRYSVRKLNHPATTDCFQQSLPPDEHIRNHTNGLQHGDRTTDTDTSGRVETLTQKNAADLHSTGSPLTLETKVVKKHTVPIKNMSPYQCMT